MQPVIRELFDTRQFQQCLLNWMGSEQTYYEFIQDTWKDGVLAQADWNQALHDGVYVAEYPALYSDPIASKSGSDKETEAEEMPQMSSLAASVRRLAAATNDGMSLVLYTKVGMGDGR